jgi:hypothetical protein
VYVSIEANEAGPRHRAEGDDLGHDVGAVESIYRGHKLVETSEMEVVNQAANESL